MNNTGFYIRKLKIIGLGKTPAEITFKKGLNIISGPSNTGKSYIYSCLTYMLGAKNPPKDIDQSKGYESILLEISSFDGLIYTLKRKITGGQYLYANCKISEFQNFNNKEKLKTKGGNSDLNDNISDFLLDFLSLDGKVLKKNARNTKVNLSFRNIRHLTAIDEVSILKESSPVLSIHDTEKTLAKSTFELLLTGKDASELQEVEEKKIFQSRLKGKIELIQNLIHKSNETLVKLDNNKSEITPDAIRSQITILINKLSDQNKLLQQYYKSRKLDWEKMQKYESDKIFKIELLERFNLLREHYKSDLERLQFVLEGNDLINQLNKINCPICGGNLSEDHYDCLKKELKITDKGFSKSINVEIKKINIKLNDLEETINRIESDLNLLNSQISNSKDNILKIDIEINKNLKPRLIGSKKDLDVLNKEYKSISQIALIKSQLTDYYSQLKRYQDESLKPPKVSNEDETLPYTKLKKLCTEIESLLKAWNFPNVQSVEFDTSYEKFDIDISGSPRKNHGKGFRAITYSAFVIGLMNYCENAELPHSNLIILDSPLTTYHGKDEDEESKKDDVPSDIQSSFFKNLAKLEKNKQIIILENKQPNKKVIEKINYLRFTRDEDFGRYGFFPIYK